MDHWHRAQLFPEILVGEDQACRAQKEAVISTGVAGPSVAQVITERLACLLIQNPGAGRGQDLGMGQRLVPGRVIEGAW